MKRLILSILVALTAIGASAEFHWGLTAGPNFTSYHFKQKLFDVKMSTGFQGGVIGELMFPGIGFGVDFGLMYNMHGSKLDLGSRTVWASDGYGNEQIWIHSLQLPVHLRFKYTNLNGVERTIAPFAFAGPNFSFTVANNGCKAIEYPGGSVVIQFGLGAELFEKYQIFGMYNLGVTYEMRTVKLENESAQQRGWQVGVAYMF